MPNLFENLFYKKSFNSHGFKQLDFLKKKFHLEIASARPGNRGVASTKKAAVVSKLCTKMPENTALSGAMSEALADSRL